VQPDPGESQRTRNAGLAWQDLASQARSVSSNLTPVTRSRSRSVKKTAA